MDAGKSLILSDSWYFKLLLGVDKRAVYLRNRSALAVNCCVIIHCLEFSCKEDQITSA